MIGDFMLDWAMAEDEEVRANVFLGRVMYPDYEQYWLAVLANPAGVLPFSGREPTKNEIAYARLADKTPHLVVSKTLDKVVWRTSRIVRDVDEIRQLKQRSWAAARPSSRM